ncbi:MAG TPA: hypothetical protein VE175_14795, partial [Woeseiaceae bacterium]|nr:hypothetical protein [Woeseiaceae bacterium]
NTPVLLGNPAEFRRRFGGAWSLSGLGPAVEQFFEHGGRRLYVVRVANNARGAMICLPASHGVLVLRAIDPGSTELIRAAVDYDRIGAADREHFNLTLQRIAPETGLVVDQEIYPGLTCREDDRGFVGNALLASSLARVQMPAPAERPMPTGVSGGPLDPGYVGPAQPGSDGADLTDYDLIGAARQCTGLFALNEVDRFDLLYLPPPGGRRDHGPAAVLAAELYCRRRGAMLVMDPPHEWMTADEAVSGMRRAGYASPNLLTYFPRVCERGDTATRAAGGAVAGLLCRHDRQFGTWQALDGTALAISRRLMPAISLAVDEARRLVKEGFNVITGLPSGRPALGGSVTLARNRHLHADFASLHVRRLCLSITGAIERATRWAVFEADGERVAHRIESQVRAYLSRLAGAGAFAGDRYAVQCDADLHAGPRDPRRGITILLTFQPAGAAEPLSLTLHQTAAGCRVTISAFPPAIAQCA